MHSYCAKRPFTFSIAQATFALNGRYFHDSSVSSFFFL